MKTPNTRKLSSTIAPVLFLFILLAASISYFETKTTPLVNELPLSQTEALKIKKSLQDMPDGIYICFNAQISKTDSLEMETTADVKRIENISVNPPNWTEIDHQFTRIVLPKDFILPSACTNDDIIDIQRRLIEIKSSPEGLKTVSSYTLKQ